MASEFDPVPACFSGVGYLPKERIERQVVERLARWERHTGQKASLPIDIEELVEVVEGIEVDFIQDDSEMAPDVLGAYDFSEKKLYVREAFDHEGRRRFTWAHEYGHFVLHSPHFLQQVFDFFEAGKQGTIQLNRGTVDRRNVLEWQANQFASSILMPAHLVRAAFESKRDSLNAHELVVELASLAAVSKQAARIRLEQLDLIPKFNP